MRPLPRYRQSWEEVGVWVPVEEPVLRRRRNTRDLRSGSRHRSCHSNTVRARSARSPRRHTYHGRSPTYLFVARPRLTPSYLIDPFPLCTTPTRPRPGVEQGGGEKKEGRQVEQSGVLRRPISVLSPTSGEFSVYRDPLVVVICGQF